MKLQLPFKRTKPMVLPVFTHIDHSCVSRAEYDAVLRALGHWRWRARELEAELARRTKDKV